MAVTANSIVTPQTPRSAFANAAVAQTAFPPTVTPANTVLLLTVGSNGGRLTRLQAIPCETITAANLQIYRSIDAGASKYLATAATTGSDTVSATDGPGPIDFGYSDDNPMILQANERVYVATGIAKSFNFIAEWADY